MTCERYWRDGIVLVERGLDDPHRAGCMDCARAHASRQELIDALPLIGEGKTGDPLWQAKVWRRIDRETRARQRWRWPLTGALVAACAVALWLGLGRTRPVDVGPPPMAVRPPAVEVRPPAVATEKRPSSARIPGAVATRAATDSESAKVGDRMQVRVGPTWDVWIYRDGRFLLRCQAGRASPGCTPDREGLIAEIELTRPVEYIAIAFESPPSSIEPKPRLDAALGELESRQIMHREFRMTVY